MARPWVTELASRAFGDGVAVEELYGEYDLNCRVRAPGGRQLVLKVTADASPESRDRVELQARILEHLAGQELATEVPRVVPTSSGDVYAVVADPEGNERLAWTLTWIEGELLDDVETYDADLLESLGRAVGEVDRALIGFEHLLADRDLMWDSLRVPELRPHLAHVADPEEQRLAGELFDVLEEALPALASRPRSVIHNDGGNQHNMIVRRGGEGARVVGIIDFGDAVRTARICGLGIAAAYATFGVEDPIEAIEAVARGYRSVLPLEEEDRSLLLPATLARLLATVTVAAERAAADPDDAYATVSARGAWRSLRRLHRMGTARS